MTVNPWKPEKHIKTPEPCGRKLPGHDCWSSELSPLKDVWLCVHVGACTYACLN